MNPDHPGDESNKSTLAAYAGRWIAWLKGSIVGQGGTPEQALQAAKSTRHKEIPQVSFVNTSSSLSFSPLFSKIVNVLPKTQSIYLVGGAVRDAVLNKKAHDLDFAMLKNAQKIARKVANELEGAYYRLDDEHEAARVVLIDENKNRQVIDFAVFRGPDLEADLRGRDFTINALAVDVKKPGELLDPLGGMSDLYHKQIKPCSPSSFSDDPLRTLRAIRFAATLKFKILAECKKGIRDAVVDLPNISGERVRDELFKILDAPQVATSMRVMDILGILPYVLPELVAVKGIKQSLPHQHDVWEHTLQTVKHLEKIINQLDSQYRHENEDGGDLATGLIAIRLGRFREHFTDHINSQLTIERKYRPLLILSALYHDVGKLKPVVQDDGKIKFPGHEAIGTKLAMKRAKALHLSNAETHRLNTIIQFHHQPNHLSKREASQSRRDIYRFFRDVDEAGVSISLLALADLLAFYGQDLKHETLENFLDSLRLLLGAYWENKETQISPPILVDGNELIKTFEITAGPIIGKILEAIREAQAVGEISTKKEAFAIAKEMMG